MTVAPPENAESCSLTAVGCVPGGVNTDGTCTWFPELMFDRNASPLGEASTMSSFEYVALPAASLSFWFAPE